MTDRPTASTINDAQLDALYQRLERAEAAIARVRHLAARIRQGAPWTANDDNIAAHILAALDAPAPVSGPAATQTTEPEDPCRKYPYQDGEVTVLGPDIFASSDGAVISWKGDNYVRQVEACHRDSQVTDLYERWVKAGPPPIGAALSRWWDIRLAELHDAILNPTDANNAPRTTPNNPATSTWTPPPPGSTREQLPNHILQLIRPYLPAYLSTACQTGHALAEAIADRFSASDRETVTELQTWRERMRQRCRENQKFTGQLCVAGWHDHEQPGPAAVVEVRDPCPYCEDCPLIPRHHMAGHMREHHPEEQQS